MTTVLLSRDEVIAALNKEPLRNLRAGQWASNNGCQVCAVGAVIRSCLAPEYRTNDRAISWSASDTTEFGVDACGDEGVPHRRLSRREAMSALSALFETSVGTKRVTGEDRERLVRYVRRYFPKLVEVRIDDQVARPRAGLTTTARGGDES